MFGGVFFSLFLSGEDTRYKYAVTIGGSLGAVSLARSCGCSHLQGAFFSGGWSERVLSQIDLLSLKRKKSVFVHRTKFLISYLTAL